MWDKYANLFAHIDKERARFLDFERWWNGFYGFSREEIVAIIENQFVGNKLEQREMHACRGCSRCSEMRTCEGWFSSKMGMFRSKIIVK